MRLTLGSYLISKDARFSRNPDFIFRKIVDEYILVPMHRDVADMECIYTLNPVGAFIWQQLETSSTLNELQDVMLDEYDADPEIINADLIEFLREMTSIGAIKEG
jgi:hypothetical protein